MVGGPPAALVALLLACGAASAAPSFPGAEGYGKTALGGRGGAVIAVTRHDDAADADGRPMAGTLRACVNASGPRTCVFRVGGVFTLTRGALRIENSFITIAGQTAPGGGVLITHDEGSAARTPVLVRGATDVVIRHIRSRPGSSPVPTSNDAFTIENSRGVILDHVSGSWAEDENVNAHGGTTDLTVSWSIFAEGVLPHSKCALLSSGPTVPQRITFARNLCASNSDRNPDLHGDAQSCLDVVNNVFYNANDQFTEIWGNFGGLRANIAGNTYRRGPSTNFMVYGLIWQEQGAIGTPSIFALDNRADGARITLLDPELTPFLTGRPACALSVGRDAAAKAYTQVLAKAGAFPRDDVDARIVGEVESRSGGLKAIAGAIPTIAWGTPYADGDNDGMADGWEAQNRLRPGVFDAWVEPDASGFFALDRFLDYAHRTRMSGGIVQ